MSNRHLARSIVMQTLYQWDFRGGQDLTLDQIINQNIHEFGIGLEEENVEFSRETATAIVKNLKEIDEKIKKFSPDWTLEQMTVIDRNVLRIGVYELYFNKEIPNKVAINEAIELAKTFSGQSSGKFVNGILGTVYKQLEPDSQKDAPEEKTDR